jgi:hypothetical protein
VPYSVTYILITLLWLGVLKCGIDPVVRFRDTPDINLGVDIDFSEVFMVFLSPSKQMCGQYFKLYHNRFLLYPFQFIIHQ